MKTFVKEKWKSLVALVLLYMLVVSVPVSALTPLDPTQTGSLNVNFIEGSFPDYLKDDLVFDFYLIATLEVSEDGRAAFYPDDPGPFADLDFSKYVNGTATNDDMYDLGQQAITIVRDAYENNPIEPAYRGEHYEARTETDVLGVYLVLARLEDQEQPEFAIVTNEDGSESVITKVYDTAGNTDFLFNPVLMTVPRQGADGESEWVYDDGVSLKIGQSAHDYVTLYKEDAETGERLPGAKFKLYSTTATPGDDYILRYDENGQEIYLYALPAEANNGYYVSGEDGSITIPFDDPDALYALVEVEAPDGYEVDATPYYFYVNIADVDGYIRESGQPAPGSPIYARPEQDHGQWAVTCTVVGVNGSQKDVVFINEPVEGAAAANAYVGRTGASVNANVTHPKFDGVPRWIRAKKLAPEGYMIDVAANDGGWAQMDDKDDWYYYQEILYPGETTTKLSFFDKEGGAGENIRVIYETIPAFDESGEMVFPFEAPWFEGEENIGPSAPEAYIHQLTDDYQGANVIYFSNTRTPEEPPEEPGVTLPSTGGTGTTIFTVAGLALIITSVVLSAIEKKRTRGNI